MDQEAEAPLTEYILDLVFGPLDTESGIYCRVHYYGYCRTDDTYEPSDGFPQTFNDRFTRSYAMARANTRRVRIRWRNGSIMEKRPALRDRGRESRSTLRNLGKEKGFRLGKWPPFQEVSL